MGPRRLRRAAHRHLVVLDRRLRLRADRDARPDGRHSGRLRELLPSLNLKIITDEVGCTAFDTLTVRIGSTVLATYGNVNASPYTPRSFNVAVFADQNVTISFTGSEDPSVQTSFVLDDLSLTTS